MTKVVHVSGRRKKAVARATAKPGKGIIRVNRQLLSNYSTEFNRLKMLENIFLNMLESKGKLVLFHNKNKLHELMA